MPLRCFALEYVARAAIGANGFAGMQDIEKDARMLIPRWRAKRGAVQGQVVGCDFNSALDVLFGHVGNLEIGN
jgi:hypothetical protein